MVQSLAAAPSDASRVYAGLARGGIYRSVDGGASWNAATAGLSDFDVRSLAVSPADADRVIAGTTSGGFLSVDGGASSWP